MAPSISHWKTDNACTVTVPCFTACFMSQLIAWNKANTFACSSRASCHFVGRLAACSSGVPEVVREESRVDERMRTRHSAV